MRILDLYAAIAITVLGALLLAGCATMPPQAVSRKAAIVFAMLGLGALLAGCATTAPRAVFSQEIAPTSRVTAQDEVGVQIEAESNVSIDAHERVRLAERIQEQLSIRKASHVGSGNAHTYRIIVMLTRYQRGNAFARVAWPLPVTPIGQIRISGRVRLVEMPEATQVSEFHLHKTFAVGGPLGGFTHMQDVEKGFASGIATALTD
jgi:predicted small secreted protein